MSLGGWFSMKGRKQWERDQRRFERNSFPFGKAQRDKIEAILAELFPGERKQMTMLTYLVGRQAYYNNYQDPEDLEDEEIPTHDACILQAANTMGKQLPGKQRRLMWRYLALILADEQVGESLDYPTAEELLQRAQALEETL